MDSQPNVVLISITSMVIPNLAPREKHILHTYTSRTQSYDLWYGLDCRRVEYKKHKAKRFDVMRIVVQSVLGAIFSQEKHEVKLVGAPLTHQQFLQRNGGTYRCTIHTGEVIYGMGVSDLGNNETPREDKRNDGIGEHTNYKIKPCDDESNCYLQSKDSMCPSNV